VKTKDTRLNSIELAKALLCCGFLIMTALVRGQTAVPVRVIDHGGATVSGLQKSDFTVHFSGDSQLESAEEVLPAVVTGFANPIPIFILYDANSIPSPRQGEASKILLKLLCKVTEENSAVTLAVTTGDGLEAIHEFSTDVRVLRAALDRISKATSGGQLPEDLASPGWEKKVKDETQRLQRLTHLVPGGQFKAYTPITFQQLAGLQQFGNMLKGYRRRKALVWITGYFPLDVDRGDLLFNGGAVSVEPGLKDLLPAYQGAIDSLNQARVSLFPVQVDVNVPWQRTKIGLEDLSKRTGGYSLAPLDDNDLWSTLEALRKHFGSYYLLQADARTRLKKVTWVSIKVGVSRNETSVIAPNGFFLAP
jgi:VWFA-related protein